jgi:hypothetical protein
MFQPPYKREGREMSPPFGEGHRCEDYNWLDGYCGCHLMEPISPELMAVILRAGSEVSAPENSALTKEEIDSLLKKI